MCDCAFRVHPGVTCGSRSCHCHDREDIPTVEPTPYSPSEIMRFFDYEHLPPTLAAASMPFQELASTMDEFLPEGAEKESALRKILEAKDAAVRACLDLV